MFIVAQGKFPCAMSTFKVHYFPYFSLLVACTCVVKVFILEKLFIKYLTGLGEPQSFPPKAGL